MTVTPCVLCSRLAAALLAARPGVALGSSVDAATCPSSRLSLSLAERRHLETVLDAMGPPPEDFVDDRDCLSQMLKGADPLLGGERITAVPYVADKVKLVSEDHTAIDIYQVLDEDRGAWRLDQLQL